MKITTLENTSLATITKAFNRAFSDYIIPIQWTEQTLAQKITGDNIDLSLSPGCFVDGTLCGLIFHGIGQRDGQPIVWNGGTGVAPEQRGQGITTRLYEYIIPQLQAKGFQRTVLEVIVGNDPAIHLYKKNGFSISRRLMCYKGQPAEQIQLPENIRLENIEQPNWPLLHQFRSWQPTFQNDDRKIILLKEHIKLLGAFQDNKLVAYIAFDKNPDAGDIFQFAVDPDYRRQKIGTTLFHAVAQQKTVPLKIINVDARHSESITFFENIGFEKIVEQLEMLMNL